MSDPYLDDLEFANKANIEAARKFKAERDALRNRLAQGAPIHEALEAAQRALASCRHLMTKYIPAHDWLPHIDDDIAKVKAALSPTDGQASEDKGGGK